MDLDVTDDLVHGSQEQAFFNTYYGGYCYAPLYINCCKHLLAAKLRPSNVDPAEGALEELQQVIKQIRFRWGNVRILVRGDSAYSREEIMSWCELQPGVDYVFGLAKNSRLIKMTAQTQNRAKQEYSQNLETVVSFLETLFTPDDELEKQASELIDSSIWYRSLSYQTLESWSCTPKALSQRLSMRRLVQISVLSLLRSLLTKCLRVSCTPKSIVPEVNWRIVSRNNNLNFLVTAPVPIHLRGINYVCGFLLLLTS